MSLETNSTSSNPGVARSDAAAAAARATRQREGADRPNGFGAVLAALEPEPEGPATSAEPQPARKPGKPAALAKGLAEDAAGAPSVAQIVPSEEAAVAPLSLPGAAAALPGEARPPAAPGAGPREVSAGGKPRAAGVPADVDQVPAQRGGARSATALQQADHAQAVRQRDGAQQDPLQAQALSSFKGVLARGVEARTAAQELRADGRDRLSGPGPTGLNAAAPPTQEGAALLASAGLFGRRNGDRASAAAAAPGSATTPAGWSAHAAPQTNGAAAAGAGLDGSAAMAPESALAEKLNYWIAGGVQNAELQLDAFGGGSVEVRIAVHGQQAQVDFRSDQPEARRMLQDAMPQLRAMLEDQGMSLAGGFVGTSAGQDPQARSPERQMRSARIAPAGMEASPMARGARAPTSSGGSIDLFV